MLIENAAPSHLVPAREIAADARPPNALFLCMLLAITCRELSATDDVATFEITCADTDIGMSPEFQQHAFEPFAQEAKAGTSTYTGSGLGLAIVKELVEQRFLGRREGRTPPCTWTFRLAEGMKRLRHRRTRCRQARAPASKMPGRWQAAETKHARGMRGQYVP